MRLIKFLLIGLVVTTSFSSCKKVYRERKLWKHGGEWVIESFVRQKVSVNGADNYTKVDYNIGSLTFNDNGNGHFDHPTIGGGENKRVRYSSKKDKLTVIFFGDVSLIYNMNWHKEKLELSYSVTYSDTSYPFTIYVTYNLKRKK